MDITRCCWKRSWTHSAFEEPATEPPTGSILGRLPDAVAWTGSTKTTAARSKTSMSTRRCAMHSNGYALIQPGRQIRLLRSTSALNGLAQQLPMGTQVADVGV